ncbi:MAG: permease-like cell division protein FtsX [Armatimonadota bacterium]|nr:permease-like cell division protein FtsX [bacterium]
MKLRNVEFIIQESFTGIWRNGLMAFASISTIALSLGVLGAFVMAALGATHFARTQIGQFQIAVFMRGEANRSRTDDVASQIRKMTGVGSVEVRDRDQEWLDFKRQHPNIDSAGLPTNVLPYAMDVKVSDPNKLPTIASKVRVLGGVDTVIEGRETFHRVMAVAKVVSIVSVAGAIMLLVTTAFIISNAIRLTLYARRREIRIMQLVGATNRFIRLPLFIEGIVFGTAGALVAWCLLRLGSMYLAHAVERITPLLGRASSGVEPSALAVYLVITGAAIGAVGSMVSIRRFLTD